MLVTMLGLTSERFGDTRLSVGKPWEWLMKAMPRGPTHII